MSSEPDPEPRPELPLDPELEPERSSPPWSSTVVDVELDGEVVEVDGPEVEVVSPPWSSTVVGVDVGLEVGVEVLVVSSSPPPSRPR